MDKEELKRLIIDNMPDYMKGQVDEIQEAYIGYELTKREYEILPERYFHFVNKAGKDCTVDTNAVNIRISVKRQGGTDEQAEEAVAHRNKYTLPVIRKLGQYRKKMKNLFGGKYSVAIMENGDEIIDLYAQCYTTEDIASVLKVKKGYTVSPSLLKVFYQDNKQTIEKRKLKFLDSKKDFFISTETGRLQVLNELLLSWRLRFDREGKLSYSAEIRKVLEQARKECKGEQLFLTVDGKIDVNAMVHGQDNVSEALQKLPINMIIIGLVAAKAGINPATIMGQLASSYYKDHNGYNKNFLDGQDIQLPGDIIRNMSWEELGEKSRMKFNEISPMEDAIIVEDSELPKVEGGREKLLEMLRKGISRDKLEEERAITEVNEITRRRYQKKRDNWSEEDKKAYWREYHRRFYHLNKERKKKEGKKKKDEE